MIDTGMWKGCEPNDTFYHEKREERRLNIWTAGLCGAVLIFNKKE